MAVKTQSRQWKRGSTCTLLFLLPQSQHPTEWGGSLRPRLPWFQASRIINRITGGFRRNPTVENYLRSNIHGSAFPLGTRSHPLTGQCESLLSRSPTSGPGILCMTKHRGSHWKEGESEVGKLVSVAILFQVHDERQQKQGVCAENLYEQDFQSSHSCKIGLKLGCREQLTNESGQSMKKKHLTTSNIRSSRLSVN